MIEALTVLFIFALITTSFYSMISIGSRHIVNAKNRLGALSLANEKMEIARNLPYNSLGTNTGAVSGALLEYEEVTKNTKLFHVHTIVSYVQDSFDGVSPSDVAWNDYKKVQIVVSWDTGSGGTDSVDLVSRFVPPGLEVLDPNAGILMINVFSDQPGGAGISGSTLHIVNADTGLDTTVTTESDGSYMLMGNRVGNSIEKYQITATKNGYETVQTYPPYPDTEYYPVDKHASVILGSLNVINIIQNKFADFTIKAVDYLDQGIPNVNFSVVGGRKLGIDAAIPPNDVYNLNETRTTDSDGEREFNDVSPGNYILDPNIDTAIYELIGVSPTTSFQVYSDIPLTVKMKLAEKAKTGILIKVIKDGIVPDSSVENAVVRITKGTFTDELTTTTDGAVYFPKDATPLEAGTYDVHVTNINYADNNFQIIVNDGALSTSTASMQLPM